MEHVEAAQKWVEWALAQGDERVKDWPLMDIKHVLALIGGYLVVVYGLVFIMKHKEKPFSMKFVSMLHNIHLTALSAYMCFECIHQAIRGGYSLFGNGVDSSENGIPMARIIWIFYVSKVAEFGDTIIMALKKNFHQISFLHVYHHTSIFFIWWIITKYAPGGEAYFSAALNSFIHVLMYGYYLWSSLAPKLDKSQRPTPCQPAFYRKYITRMQLLQFCTMLVQSIYDQIVPNPYPMFCIKILFYYMFTMLGLFANFYVQAYLGGKTKKVEKTQ